MLLKYHVDILLLVLLERFWSISGTSSFSNVVRDTKQTYYIIKYLCFQNRILHQKYFMVKTHKPFDA